jgi:hypothetical protein
MNLNQERRFIGSADISGNQFLEILPPQNGPFEIEEIFFQVADDGGNITAQFIAEVAIAIGSGLVGQAAKYQSPYWQLASGGFVSDPGFILISGSNIVLDIQNFFIVASFTLSWIVRYRAYGCHTGGDPGIRATGVNQ